jgi:hypothetical protein
MQDHKKRLTIEDRKNIETLLLEGHTQKEVAKRSGIHVCTLYREIKKCGGFYNAEEAHKNTCKGMHPIDYEIVGKRYGLLTVVEYVNKIGVRTYWKCKCDCGRTTVISRKILTEYCSKDRQLSCGCIAKESRGPNGQVSFEEASLRKFQDLIAFRKIVGDCWEWQGYRQKGKTPKTSWKNKAMTVRKCMYLLINGTTYEPNAVHTTCGNLSCFNPDHITLERPARRHLYKDQE